MKKEILSKQNSNGIKRCVSGELPLDKLTKFAIWWEHNIADKCNGKHYYWNDENEKLYTPKQICKHYLDGKR